MLIRELSAPGTRLRPKPTRDQRKGLQATLASFQHPETAREVVRPCFGDGVAPEAVTCTVKSVHPDRFVMHARVRTSDGAEVGFALKVYSDDFGETMVTLGRELAGRMPPNRDRLCLPSHYLPEQRTLVFPWLEGPRLSDIVDDRKPGLLRRAARLAADLHGLPAAAVPPMTPEIVVNDTIDRCQRLRYRWPSLAPTIEPLLGLVRKAAGRLQMVAPSVIHGDMAAGQFLWSEDRLVLLDLDAAGLADPAYDVGHFLGQLERRCVIDASLPPESREWLSTFREAYHAAMPGISWPNVSFYQGITLMRKMYTLSRRDELSGPKLALPLAARARAAFETAAEGRVQ